MRERLAMLISGNGTTMQEIIKACQSGQVPMDIACVIASNPDAGGIEKARVLKIPDRDIVVVNPLDFILSKRKIDRERFGFAINDELHKRDVTAVMQCGWTILTPVDVINAFLNKIFNQHSAPVPEFGGKGMYGLVPHASMIHFLMEARPDDKENWYTEAIAQRVVERYDEGAVVKSERVVVYSDDTAQTLQQRVLPVEHRVQIALAKDIADGTVHEEVGRVPFVRPGEEEVLERAKEKAIWDYPSG